MTDCTKIQELISAMLDGEVSASDERLIKEHIESCDECRQMYEMFALVSGEIQSSLAEPPADLKEKVMSGVKTQRKRGIITILRPYMTPAACLVLVMGIFAFANGGARTDSTAAPAEPRAMADTAASAEDSNGEYKLEGYSYVYDTGAYGSVAEEASPEAPAAVSEAPEMPMENARTNIYYGTVSDRGMSKVDERDLSGRAYIGIEFDDGKGDIFWLARGYELPDGIEIGRRVMVETETEKLTGLTVATNVSIVIIEE